jgi:hypothetical protein
MQIAYSNIAQQTAPTLSLVKHPNNRDSRVERWMRRQYAERFEEWKKENADQLKELSGFVPVLEM